MVQRHPFQMLHCDEGWPVLILNFVDGEDVGVIEGGGRFGFPLEAAESLRVMSDIFRQKLEGDEPAELQILGFVNHSHPTAADLFDNAVVRDGLADHLGTNVTWGKQAKSMKVRTLVVSEKYVELFRHYQKVGGTSPRTLSKGSGTETTDTSCGSAVSVRVYKQRHAAERVLPPRFDLQHAGSPSEEALKEERSRGGRVGLILGSRQTGSNSAPSCFPSLALTPKSVSSLQQSHLLPRSLRR